MVAVLHDCSFLELPRLAERAGFLKVTRAILEETGVGFLVADRSLWALCPAVGCADVPSGDRSAAELAYKVHMAWLALKKGGELEQDADDIVSLEDDVG